MTRSDNTKLRCQLISFAVLMALTLVPTDAEAQDVLFACYAPSGVVYRVNPPTAPGQDPQLKDGCTGKKHVLFSWNEVGPAGADGEDGADGAQGPPGIVQRYAVNQFFQYPTTPGMQVNAIASCDAGDLATGGGFSTGPGHGGTILKSAPEPNARSWFVVAEADGVPGTGFAHVVCVDLPPLRP